VTGKNAYYQTAVDAYNTAMWEAKLADSLERGTPESQYTNAILDVRGA
jgi:hypothetical protein